ncbi:semaphorin-5B-like [Cyprinus carpio]|uniref:Semaphorin-5B-like n=1 Tax=Cyprinus carpio TaxID=7962 RepID=A0A9R0B0R6_CYPCA|nr:semaphorin-5B-like [Cyprinus carpio]
MKSVTGLFVVSVLLCSTILSWSATVSSYGDISRLGSPDFSGIKNFSIFLLDHVSGMLYLGARDAVIAVDTANLSKRKMIEWSVPEEKRKSCVAKGKTEDDCRNTTSVCWSFWVMDTYMPVGLSPLTPSVHLL